MSKFKKYFYYIFLVTVSIIFSACNSSSDTESQSIESNETTQVLIDNILDINQNNFTSDDSIVSEDESTDSYQKAQDIPKDSNEEKQEEDNQKISDDNTVVKLKFFGDIMAHMGQLNYAKNRGGDSYDFSSQFEYIKDFVSDSDLSMGNYETTSNPNLAYSGYPKFNTPKSYLTDIKNAGFDIVTTANNHSLDTGLDGVDSTIDAIKEAGLDYVGSHKDNNKDERILYKSVKGIKIAFLAYTYDTNVQYDNESEKINYINQDQIKEDIESAKEENADFIVVYPHWGDEYQTSPNQEQIDLAKKMADWGADIIIGNHPHVVQPAQWYKTSDNRQAYIAYSLGNFISQQSQETTGNVNTEHSVCYEVDLIKDNKSDAKKIEKVDYYPIWVGSTYDQYGQSIKTYLARDFLEGRKYANKLDQTQETRLKNAYDSVKSIVETKVD